MISRNNGGKKGKIQEVLLPREEKKIIIKIVNGQKTKSKDGGDYEIIWVE